MRRPWLSRVDVATLRTHLPRVALSPHFHPHSEWAQVVSPVPVGVRSWGALPSPACGLGRLTIGFQLSPAKWLAAVARTGRRLGIQVARSLCLFPDGLGGDPPFAGNVRSGHAGWAIAMRLASSSDECSGL